MSPVNYYPRLLLGLALLLVVSSALAASISGGISEAGSSASAFASEAERIINEARLGSADVSFVALDLETGSVLYAASGSAPRNPASNVKIMTTSAALFVLRPHFAFKTEVYAEQPIASAELAGDIFVKGYGDPFLVTEEVVVLAESLRSLSLRAVKGRIVIDQSHFDEKPFCTGYEQEKGDHAYLAPVMATSVNFNTVTLRVSPGAEEGAPVIVFFEPPCRYLKLVNNAKTVKSGSRSRLVVSSVPEGKRNKIIVKGRMGAGAASRRIFRRIADPSLNAGWIIKEIFKSRGIEIAGEPSAGKVPDGATLLETHISEPLAALVRKINKHSSNFMSEMLLKEIGAAATGEPGTSENGLKAVREFLEKEVGIAPGSYTMVNGSGLNQGNLFSAEQIVKLLRYMWGKFDIGPEFVSSLSVAAADGTIRKRLKGSTAAEMVRAKTGLLKGVAALSGYAMSKSGKPIAFSAIANGVRGGTEKARVMFDRLAELMVNYEPSAQAASPGETAK